MIYHLNIGSNLGDRHATIRRAVDLLRDRVEVVAVSAPVESAPWGFDSPHAFVNVGVNVETTLTPLQLLEVTQEVERACGSANHRDAAGAYIDRVVDVDIIAAEAIIVTSRRITVPHPLMHRRRFVLEPLAELLPQWVHPLLQLTAAELLAALATEPVDP